MSIAILAWTRRRANHPRAGSVVLESARGRHGRTAIPTEHTPYDRALACQGRACMPQERSDGT